MENKELVERRIKTALKFLGDSRIALKPRNDSVIELEIVSNYFANIAFLKRLDLVCDALMEIMMEDLKDKNLVVFPLTVSEVVLGSTDFSPE
jgi:stress-induced morphogen